jgi:Lar family restriction alleviation protein
VSARRKKPQPHVPKPCPFCGSTDELRTASISTTEHHDGEAVFCDGCGAQGPICPTATAAISAWNGARRKPEDP